MSTEPTIRPKTVTEEFYQAMNKRLIAAEGNYVDNRKRFVQMRSALSKVAGQRNDTRRVAHISRMFTYSPADATAAARAIRPLFVEPLLQQAATFVNRVLAEEPTYRQLQIDQTNLTLDLKEFEVLDEINTDEVAAGLFKMPFWEAAAGLISDNAFRHATGELADFVHDNSANQKQFAAWSAENGHIPSMAGPGTLTKIAHPDLLVGKKFDKDWSQFKVPGNLPPTTVGDEGWIIGGMISYAIADYSITYQEKQLRATLEPIAQREDMMVSRAGYLDADAGFRKRRKIAAHDKLIVKLAAINAPDGPLNYSDRIEAIEKRAAVDLREAYSRMMAVAEGIKVVFGLQPPALPWVPKKPEEGINGKLLQELVTWLREVALTVSDIAARDQEYVHSISLRQFLGSPAFEKMRDASTPRWDFDVDARRFSGLKYIRLRGVSLEVDSAGDTSYGFILSTPVQAANIYQVGQAAVPAQQIVGDVWVGRARGHASPRDPELVGSRVLNNASPIGKWSIAPAPLQARLDQVTDIRINLHVVIQSG
jgi:hypothetical protein